MRARDFLRKAVYRPAVFLCILSFGSASVSLGYQTASPVYKEYMEINGPETISKILSVLEIRNPDQKIMDKAAEKLSAMNRRDIQLISSLCDRIFADGGTAGADIAFSLITAIIVLS